MLATAIMGTVGIVFAIVGVMLFVIGRRGAQRAALIQQVPTSPAADAARQAPGTLVEVTGTLRCAAPLTSELSGRPCAFTDLQVHRERDVRERKSDGEWETTRRSDTVSHTSLGAPFYVEDGSGQVLVRTDGADVDAMTVVDRFEPASTGTSLSIAGLTLSLGTGDDTVGYRYRESILPVDAPVYVLGVVGHDGSIGAPLDQRPNQAFTISYRSEAALVQSTGQSAFWLRMSGIGAMALGVVLHGIGVVVGRL